MPLPGSWPALRGRTLTLPPRESGHAAAPPRPPPAPSRPRSGVRVRLPTSQNGQRKGRIQSLGKGRLCWPHILRHGQTDGSPCPARPRQRLELEAGPGSVCLLCGFRAWRSARSSDLRFGGVTLTQSSCVVDSGCETPSVSSRGSGRWGQRSRQDPNIWTPSCVGRPDFKSQLCSHPESPLPGLSLLLPLTLTDHTYKPNINV